MSSEEEGMAVSGDEEEYDFEYSSDEPGDTVDEEDDVEVAIENKYYNAKSLCDEDPAAARAQLLEVVDMEQPKGKWGFKALKGIVKLCIDNQNFGDAVSHYRHSLTYVDSAVNQSASEKGINSILDAATRSHNNEFIQTIFEATLDALQANPNERLWFKITLKLAELSLERQEYSKTAKYIKQLHKSCQNEAGGANLSKKGTQLLQIYALEIQLYTATKNNKKLKALYDKSLQVKSAVPHPRIMGIIRECGGKAHMYEGEWSRAYSDFFDAFKSYDEAGSERRIHCLKYLVLANMLNYSAQKINPFDSPEVKSYEKHPEIVALTTLMSAYESNDIRNFEKILKTNWNTIMSDDFLRSHIEVLLNSLRTQVLLDLLQPYTRITLPFISEKLNIPVKDVQELLVSLILDNKLSASIDQVNQLVILHKGSADTRKYKALERWAKQLPAIHNALVNKI